MKGSHLGTQESAPARDAFLAEAVRRADGEPIRISISDLLGYWTAQRRGFWVTDRIERDLAEHGLEAAPPLSEGLIDDLVELRKPPHAPSPELNRESTSGGQREREVRRVALRVDQLRAAKQGVTSVNPQDPLTRAQSLMLTMDYSQLPVMSTPRRGCPDHRGFSVTVLGWFRLLPPREYRVWV